MTTLTPVWLITMQQGAKPFPQFEAHFAIPAPPAGSNYPPEHTRILNAAVSLLPHRPFLMEFLEADTKTTYRFKHDVKIIKKESVLVQEVCGSESPGRRAELVPLGAHREKLGISEGRIYLDGDGLCK